MNRRNFVKAVGSTGVVLSVGGVGTAAAAGKGRREGASAEETVFGIVKGSGIHKTLENVLVDTDLDDVLSGKGQYTLFAPTDDAFGELSSVPSGEALADVLKYHVTRGRRYSESVLNASEIEMLNGGTVTVGDDGLNGGQANVTGPDMEASNGVVHVIDGVLLP